MNNFATVIITDIVGYSKLTGDNQELALELLAEHDKLVLKSVEKFHGAVLVNRGDGFIVMFKKPENAILCSVEVQTTIKIRNKYNSRNRKFNIRIGAHAGEYSKDKNDFYGECIDIAALLEPVAPIGGILISQNLNKLLILHPNVYSREYKKIILKKNRKMTYRIYLNLIDWYLDKSNNLGIFESGDFNKISHNYYKKSDYSASLKFSNIINELDQSENANIDNLNSICRSLLILGQLDLANKLIPLIKIDINHKIDLEHTGKIFKFEGDIQFNKRQYRKSINLYKKSYGLLKKSNSSILGELIFYIYLNLFIDNKLDKKIFNQYEYNIVNDNYRILIDCVYSIIFDKDIDDCINDIVNMKDIRLKSYGYWLLSKYYGISKNISISYKYETLAQDTLKKSSTTISDTSLTEHYLLNLLIHQKILNETSIEIDDLIDININLNENDEQNDIADEAFSFCVSCGIKNEHHYSRCHSCNANLLESYYSAN
jgi:hypothetical protein